jgi:hypothetical protein
MFFIHQSACISPQKTFRLPLFDEIVVYYQNQLLAIEPKYESIPPAYIRRMGKALRMGVGCGMSLLKNFQVDGILVGTANGGIEDSIQFLHQIEEYKEGRLTPTHFVQSTYNAIAGTLAQLTQNKGYNATHVHRGAAFENVVLDTILQLREQPAHQYLIGAVDELSQRNSRMESLAGWYKKELTPSDKMFNTISEGVIPGEGAAMFIVNNRAEGARAKLIANKFFFAHRCEEVLENLYNFLSMQGTDLKDIDGLLSGYNADWRFLSFYESIENLFAHSSIIRFKKFFGDFPTVSALAVWLAVELLHVQPIPSMFLERNATAHRLSRILIYNNYRGEQHSFFIIESAI